MVEPTGLNKLAGPGTLGTPQTPFEDPEKKACEAKGGTWDPITRTCKLPEPPKTPEQQQTEADIANLKFNTANTPKVTDQGIQIGTPELTQEQMTRSVDFKGDTVKVSQGGETFTMTRDEYKNYLNSQKGEGFTSTPETQRLAELQKRYSPEGQRQAALQAAIAEIGQIGQLDPAKEAKINHRQAFIAGLANVIPGFLGGAAVGAGAGLVGSAGALSLPGALVVGAAGAVTGLTSGYINNVKVQQKGEIGAAKAELAAATSNMRQFAMMATQDPANAEEYIDLYNQQLTRAHQARRQVKAETSGDLNSWIEDGRKDLADFDVFLQPGGKADLYGRRLQIALSEGAPLGVEDFTEEELNEMFGEA